MDKSIYNKPWHLYIAECRDKTLYVGVARDVEKRIKEHSNTKRCRYTRGRGPVKLVYSERYQDYAKARKREQEIRKSSRKEKLSLISS